MKQPSRRLNPAKLLLSKWTAAEPRNLEKHFMVTALLEPEQPGMPLELVTMEAIKTKRSFTLPWRELKDESRWLQGWR